MVGLEPSMMGIDIPYFPMSRARLTDGLFRKIIEDIDVFTSQYGILRKHVTEEARSRFLSAVKCSMSFVWRLTANSHICLVLQQNRRSIFWSSIQYPRIAYGRQDDNKGSYNIPI
jgi:hypothetical protein